MEYGKNPHLWLCTRCNGFSCDFGFFTPCRLDGVRFSDSNLRGFDKIGCFLAISTGVSGLNGSCSAFCYANYRYLPNILRTETCISPRRRRYLSMLMENSHKINMPHKILVKMQRSAWIQAICVYWPWARLWCMCMWCNVIRVTKEIKFHIKPRLASSFPFGLANTVKARHSRTEIGRTPINAHRMRSYFLISGWLLK